MLSNILVDFKDKVLKGRSLTFSEGLELYSLSQDNLMKLLSCALQITRRYRKDVVNLCTITNARSGLCPEDCIFCSQSSRYNTGVAVYPLISESQMLKRAEQAIHQKTNRFCIVTSGRGVTDDELDIICSAISKIKNKFSHLKLDASLGILSETQVDKLKLAGLDRYNHNLETAKTNFANICTTHTYEDRVRTIRFIKQAGIEVCCGGIIGLGETERQRIEFAFELSELDIDSLPLNFLNPVTKTPLESIRPLPPLTILKTIALFRFIMPTKEIRICGGRQANLRSLQSLIFMAGADAIITGNYLTTKGSHPLDDIQMIKDLGLKIDGLS